MTEVETHKSVFSFSKFGFICLTAFLCIQLKSVLYEWSVTFVLAVKRYEHRRSLLLGHVTFQRPHDEEMLYKVFETMVLVEP